MKRARRKKRADSRLLLAAWVLAAIALIVALACARRMASRRPVEPSPAIGGVAGVAIDWSRVQPRPPRSFRAAKVAAWGVYDDHRVSFYCACSFTEEGVFEASSCGFLAPPGSGRAPRIEWEHVVPAHAFGGHRPCWTKKLCRRADGKKYKGRRCCSKVDRQFAAMESDLQNLVPALGQLNADRANYSFGEVEGEVREYGACDFEIERSVRIVEPAAALLGDIARTYLYMHFVYGQQALPLSHEARHGFERWHQQDPPSDWERTRNLRIAEIQGVGNPLVGP